MSAPLALAAAIGLTALVIGVVLVVRRSLTLVRQLTFVLAAGAVAVGLAFFRLSSVGLSPELAQVTTALIAFLGAIVVLRIVGIYVFDIHLRGDGETVFFDV